MHADVTVGTTETKILAIPSNKIGRITYIRIRNPDASNANSVQIYEKFTDVDGNAVTRNIATIDVAASSYDELKQTNRGIVVYGTVYAISSVSDVEVIVEYELE